MPDTQSGDIVYCLKENNPNRPILLTHHENSIITADCLFLKCPFFGKCQLSKNHFVQNFLSHSAP